MPTPVTLLNRFIGCDVGKTEIVVFDQSTGRLQSIANQSEAIEAFAAGLDETCFLVCEATGGYESLLLDALVRAGRAVHRADARKVKAFIRSFGILGKSDAIDARALASYASERQASVPLWQPPEPDRRALQALVLTRRDLVASRTAWLGRRAAPGVHHANEVIDAVIATFDEQIAIIERRIEVLIETCQPLARDNAVLRSIPGIGPKTAAALIALMPELGSLDRRKAAALAGLAPHPRQSGSANLYRRVRGGRPDVKRTLFMAALAARNTKSDLAAFFLRLVQAGKKPILAITALMRKIIVIANAKLRDAHAQLS